MMIMIILNDFEYVTYPESFSKTNKSKDKIRK